MTSRCLVLIDLQNEFLSQGGNFPIHESSRSFLPNIFTVVRSFRDTGNCVYWIRSEYDNTSEEIAATVSQLDSFLSGTHTGRKRCCEKGSHEAQFPDEIAEVIKESPTDIVLAKSWYSAFKETPLLSELKSRKITRLFIGGLITNVCVQATVIDAIDLGLNVTVLEDCLGWRNRDSHEKALGQIRELGAQVLSSTTFTKVPQVVPCGREPAPTISTLYYVNGSIPSWRVMMALYEKGVQFEAKRLKVMSQPKETRLPPFLALNHRGKTPVFVDVIPSSDDSSTININESLAILHYLETYHKPDVPLLSPNSRRAARALVLSRIQETENLHYAYDSLEDAHFSATTTPEGSLPDAERSRLICDVHNELDFWEVYAAETPFIAGNEFGLADCAFFPILAYMVHRGFEWRRPTHDCLPDILAANASTSNASLEVSHHDGKNKGKARAQEAVEREAWPHLKAYFERVWNRNGVNGCAQRAQPDGWNRRGKANVWKGTKGNSKPLRQTVPKEVV